MAALEKQLQALDESLKAQGIDVPTRDAANTDASLSATDDIEARLLAIKEFMQQKEPTNSTQ